MPEKDRRDMDTVRTREEFAGILGISLRTLCRMEERGETPPRVQVSATRYGYRQSVIEKFLNARTRA